jgi:hypothetical protein
MGIGYRHERLVQHWRDWRAQPTDPYATEASRITFSGLDAFSGETFARADHSSGFFVRGVLGAGAVTTGKQNDEDFPAEGVFGPAYSNTQSSANGHLAYLTADAGYTFLKSPGAKLGAFVGYNYYAEDINTFGCEQLAGSLTCEPDTFSTSPPTCLTELGRRHPNGSSLMEEKGARTVCHAGVRSPLWVKRGHAPLSVQCPLYPQKRTLAHLFGCVGNYYSL